MGGGDSYFLEAVVPTGLGVRGPALTQAGAKPPRPLTGSVFTPENEMRNKNGKVFPQTQETTYDSIYRKWKIHRDRK